MRRLWKKLGGYDALVEYNECAVRQFINKWELHKPEYKDYRDFIHQQSLEVGIHLGFLDIDKYRQDIYRWYLIHPYACLENFIKDFRNDLRTFRYEIPLDTPGTNNKNALERLKDGLRKSGIGVSVEDFKFNLSNYYQLFRNKIAHQLDDRDENKIKNAFESLALEDIHKLYPSLSNALSAPGFLTFDDYILCTANLKNITDTFTTDVYRFIDWNNVDVTKLQIYKKLRSYSQNPTRIAKSLKTYILCEYGISPSREILENLTNKILDSIE